MLADEIIKNTYRTLMTRGQKGCFVYSVDPETNQFLKAAASGVNQFQSCRRFAPMRRCHCGYCQSREVKPYINAVPSFDLQVAAGHLATNNGLPLTNGWNCPSLSSPKKDFLLRAVVGESMNRRIPNGAWCLFKSSPLGSRQGKVVLVQLRDVQDPENGGQYTVKVYRTEADDGRSLGTC